MSYDIYIGEAQIDDDRDGYEMRIVVKAFDHPEAPSFPNDELTGKGNHRHPGYSAWSDFTKDAGLHDLFFEEDTGLMSRHPGAFRLTNEHHQQVAAALDKWTTEHPDTTPGFMDYDYRKHETIGPSYDYMKARLVWLEWWMRWALANCETPTIYNF